ncbi:hypothetical protein QTO30_18410 [Yoonia sp. GPGPB17]|uniref:hypothetical protein n=1 Tax=Yoonia sp. GPGPB17 TaxID=3026147 RepID=UPI0030BCD080
MNSEDIINGIFRPVIGFFLGMALAYAFQLAQSAGWMFAVGWAVFLMLLFGLVIVLDRFLDWGFGRLTGWGLKKPLRPAKAAQPHWLVRFGWVFGVIIGVGAVLLLPEEALAWLLS